MDIAGPATSPTAARKRARTGDSVMPIEAGAFVQDPDAESGGDDDDDEEGKKDKKAGRRKIKIEFINDKSRRHITFSKRKAGIMKKAYELSTLTGTQVLLLVVSETGLVYTFTTAKLQPLVTQPEGKNLIQSCLNAPAGQPPSSMPIGAPIGRSAPQPPVNAPGGLAINDDDGDDDSDNDREVKRPRRSSTDGGPSDSASSSVPISHPHGTSPGLPPRVSPIQPQNGQPHSGQPMPSQHAAPQPGVRPGQPPSYGVPQGQAYHQDPNVTGYMPYNNGYYMPQAQQTLPQGQQYPRQ